MLEKIDHELALLKQFKVSYELTLGENGLAKMLEKFFTVHMKLMREWGNMDKLEVCFTKGTGLFAHFPESYLQDLIDMFTEAIKMNPRGHKCLMNETVINLTEFCLTILRTDSQVITNPYLKAKALELVVIFLYSDSKKELTSEFSKSQVI